MRSLTAVLLLAAGCGLYNHEDVECRAAPELTPAQEVRDPVTGQCFFKSTCGPCAPCPPVHTEPTVGASVCGGPCEALSESACLDTKSCRTAYRTNALGVASFVGCWAVAEGKPPNPAADCARLEAQSCPFHDECAAWYGGESSTAMSFDHCELERESCEPGTCGGPPPCPSNSVPTTRNGCYTGHCMARSQCPKQ